MRIPERLRIAAPSEEELRRYTALCCAIEEGLHADEDVSARLQEWNRRSNRTYEPHEFTAYYGAVDTEDFVTEALLPAAKKTEDLAYGELIAVLEAVMSAALPEPEHSYYLNWLEANFPGAAIGELIYWPDQWFHDPAQLQLELSPDQIAAYAMLKSRRKIEGAPGNIALPLPLPPGNEAVICL